MGILKKTAIACLTNNPYRIKKFNELMKGSVGQPVDQPESLTAVLKFEQGEPVYYAGPAVIDEQAIKVRFLAEAPRFKQSGVFKAPDRYLYSLSGGCAIGQTGLIYDRGKRSFVDESAKEWVVNLGDLPYANAFKLPPKNYLEGVSFSFLTSGADGGFYHFLFEAMVKTVMYGELIKHADHLLFNGPVTDWKLKWIEKANIDTQKIVWADGMSHYECEQLIFTNRLVGDQQISPWCLASLNKIFGTKNIAEDTQGIKKVIWVSRKGAGARDIEWENDLPDRFPGIDFIDPSQLGVEETINKFRQATHVFGPHGAGLSNLFLCRPGTKVLEIFPEGVFFQPCYSRLSNICGLEHIVMGLDFKNKENNAYGIDALSAIISKLLC